MTNVTHFEIVHEPEHFNAVCGCTIPEAYTVIPYADDEPLPKWPCGSTEAEARANAMREFPDAVDLNETLHFSDCFLVPAYRYVQNEEGGYESFCGFNVVAYEKASQGVRRVWIYSGTSSSLPLPMEEKAAEKLRDRVLEALEGRPRYWYHSGSDDLTALPDYVTDPHRPEFN